MSGATQETKAHEELLLHPLHPLHGLTGPASWWWLSPASPGSAAAERRRHRGLPSPALGPGRYLFPEAARPAGTEETNNPAFTYFISYFAVIFPSARTQSSPLLATGTSRWLTFYTNWFIGLA